MGAAPVAGHGTRSQGDGDSKTGYPPTANAQGRGGGRPRPKATPPATPPAAPLPANREADLRDWRRGSPSEFQ